jgi:hypothetical protein
MFESNLLLFFQARIERVSYSLSQEIVTDNRNQYRQPRVKGKPPGNIDIVLTGSQNITPTGRGRLHANA